MLRCLLFILAAAPALATLQETWESGYSGDDSTGSHVLAHWKFDGDTALRDLSGKGNDLTLQGGVLNPAGRFGGGLESFPGFPVLDQRHAAVTAPKPKLSPKGAFTLELWIRPKAEFKPELRCFLLDKKYVDHTDYQWQIGDADKAGLRRMWVNLGFGGESKTIHSQSLKFEPDQWQHLAFTYDGAGEGRFFRNGEAVGGARLDGYGAITPGTKPLSIGDRLGSNYGGFPGSIDEVRICNEVRVFERIWIEIDSARRVWRRMEPAGPVAVTCTNLQRQPLKSAKLRISLGGASQEFPLPDLPAGQSFTAKYPLNTQLKPAEYVLDARFEAGDYATGQQATLKIVPRQPVRMPVIMWGAGGQEIARVKEAGFTHFIGIGAPAAGEIWAQKRVLPAGDPEYIQKTRQYLDQALECGLEVVASLSPGRVLESDPANLRLDRTGKPYSRPDICASNPDFAAFFRNVGQSVTETFGDHPAFTTVLIDTEVRDASQPSFTPLDRENYRRFAHAEIPPEVRTSHGVDWTKLKDFPADRVIPDDHPLLTYYRWFWTEGDGWNGLHSALHDGVKTAKRPDLWTFFDPAVRQPGIHGAGGKVDVLSHWTYTYPDPQRIGLCADQLFAMSEASGRHQRVMKMTQLIWYRSQTAPMGSKAPGDVVPWEDHDPEAAYITIAPMHLKEALWTKLARPVQGIMYHGWGSLVATTTPTSYRFTNPNTAPVLRELVQTVIRPLGPTLMAIPAERSEVAFFESFTSQMFAGRGGYGWNGDWAADVWLALQHAHVQTDVLYEETLLKDGLAGRKVLIMPHCDVLPKAVAARIQEWQKGGGKIVGDEFLCPAIKADLALSSFKRVKRGDQDKAAVLALAKKLEAFPFPRLAACDNPEIIVRTRRFGDAQYLFAVNDHREFGSYVGQHGLVMENGLPSRGTVGLHRGALSVYDLTRSVPVDNNLGFEGGSTWSLELGPCDGRIFVALPAPLGALKVDAPETAALGTSAKLRVQLLTTSNQPVKAVLPVRIDIRDATGNPAEGSGYYAAVNGAVDLTLDMAPNDEPGIWEIRVKDLAGGKEVVRWMRVTSPPATAKSDS